MNRLCSGVLSCFPFLCSAVSPASEVFVFQSPTMNVTVPEQPLAPGAVRVAPNSQASRYADWTNNNKHESYELLQKVARIWHEKGINDYLIIGKDSEDSNFAWEIVPYHESGWTFWKQFKVLYNLVFAAPAMSLDERQQVANDLINPQSALNVVSSKVSALSSKYDFFCDPSVIHDQRIFEGKLINVLYNNAPLAIDKNKLHFLIVTKRHRENFSEMTPEENLEASEIEQKLSGYYQDKGYSTAYMYNKKGAEAGQTVPHWHQHVIYTATKTQELYGKYLVLKNMIFGASKLPKAELDRRVSALKTELFPVLSSARVD